MRIKLDTTNKTIELEEPVNLKDFFEMLNNLLPNNLWHDYTMNINATIYWTNPIPVEYPVYPDTTPINPNYPWITYCSGSGDDSHVQNAMTVNGTFCIDVSNN